MNWNNADKALVLFLVICCSVIILVFIWFSDNNKLDRKLVKDEQGNIYEVYKRIGEVYLLVKVDTTVIRRTKEFMEDVK